MKRCKRCGGCCSDVLPLRIEEVEKIRAYVKRHRIKNRQKNPSKCPFLRRHRCAIYRIRPKCCRLYDCSRDEEIIISDMYKALIGTQPMSMTEEIYNPNFHS